MNLVAIGQGINVNAPEKRRPRGADPGLEITREGDTLVMRRVVDWPKFRRIAAEVLAHMPKPKKGANIVRDLNRSRLRGGR